MSEVIRLRVSPQIEEEAAAWVWRLDSEAISNEERRSFEEWLRRDPRHRRAFEELGGVWRSLDALSEAKRQEKLATFSPIAVSSDVSKIQSRAKYARRYWLPALAASALLTVAVTFWLRGSNEAQLLATAVGQRSNVVLADGSSVLLNTNTIVRTEFTGERRDLRVVKGEALFRVAKDTQRPFRVFAGDTVVQALGTQFNVRLRGPSNVQVTVAEGRVAVSAAQTENAMKQPGGALLAHSSRALAAGQQADNESGTLTVTGLNTESLANALAWRDGAVVFDGEPLSHAIAELNRYTETRFIVTDPAVAELRIGGRFRTNDIEGFLKALREALPVATRRTADGLVFIEPLHGAGLPKVSQKDLSSFGQ